MTKGIIGFALKENASIRFRSLPDSHSLCQNVAGLLTFSRTGGRHENQATVLFGGAADCGRAARHIRDVWRSDRGHGSRTSPAISAGGAERARIPDLSVHRAGANPSFHLVVWGQLDRSRLAIQPARSKLILGDVPGPKQSAGFDRQASGDGIAWGPCGRRRRRAFSKRAGAGRPGTAPIRWLGFGISGRLSGAVRASAALRISRTAGDATI